MESKVFYAKSSEEAVEQLLKSTKADKDSIKITVLEKPSKGFLGIGAKSGVFSLEYEVAKETEPAKEEILVEDEVLKTDPSGQDKVENKEIQDKVNITDEDEIRIAREFVVELLKNADVEAEVDVVLEDNLIKVKISGDDASCLIGRRGDTLDAIQFLTGLALNKFNKDSHTRVFVDIENYRSKREESLKRYCYKAAREVAKTRRTKKLDFMNPYERRIIHSALQNDRFVITYSEGTDPYRRVVIEYKR
ncbi:MAG: protein jag [Peptostreptococcus sp.]|uniref:RNA-binding cell elongation regulator Jag/EloR n=1 Tax=Peptostreptococcus sp. TaxID=1262 RepID=UPI001CAF95CC|nr:RNA-binding cell elongation regulator Jag/EloR [Peptostreptococcus sp.]MBF1044539.1 protein jag [Peptostreptococcus sp.]MBF1063345.1 protein jag [Peptostreptococcus sp.]